MRCPHNAELPFHSRAMCVAGGLNYMPHSHQPPFTSPPCSTQPPIQSTSRQEVGPLLRGSRICSGTTAAGSFNSSTPRLPLVTLVTTSRQKNTNTEAAFHCRLRRDCLPFKSFVNAPDPTLIPLLGVKGVLLQDICQ